MINNLMILIFAACAAATASAQDFAGEAQRQKEQMYESALRDLQKEKLRRELFPLPEQAPSFNGSNCDGEWLEDSDGRKIPVYYC